MRSARRSAHAALLSTLLAAVACGDKSATQSAPSNSAPISAASATREMDEVVARVASGQPVDPKEAKDKALRDAKSFGVLALEDGKKDGAPLASAWDGTDRVLVTKNPPAVAGGGVVVIKSIEVLPSSPPVEEQVRERVLPKLELCWAEALTKDPAATARFTVGVAMQPSGEVHEVTLGSAPAPATGIGACVSQAFKSTRFTLRADAAATRVEAVVTFDPAAAPRASASAQATGPSISGKPIDKVTAEDVEKALATASCTDIENEPKPKTKGARQITATCGGKAFTLTFIPKSGRGDELDVDEVTRLVKVAALHRDGPFFLAIEGEDKRAAEELLAKLVQNR